MVRVYTTRAKKSSVFLCFFIKIFSGFSIPRVVNVFIPVFSRVCGIFCENVSTDSRNRFSRKFRSKNDHPVGFAGWSQGGFSVLGILPDGARAFGENAPTNAQRPDFTARRPPACSFHFFQLPQCPLRVLSRPKLRPDPPRVRRVALVVLLRHRPNQLRQLA